jgi:zinc transport system substrate-binding protein
MKRLFCLFSLMVLISCGRGTNKQEAGIITVSIPPFKFFVEEIAGDHFKVNVMVPPGANPHIYEPSPDQIVNLRKSVAYLSNGYLGFEDIWLDRFFEINRNMKRLNLSQGIEPIFTAGQHESLHDEAVDPHYWVSPVCALKMALSVKEFLCGLDQNNRKFYEDNFEILSGKIRRVDSLAKELGSKGERRIFMIYHPDLAYLARDYGLEEISVENEGKEPTPASLKKLIDTAKDDNLKVILVQKEFDTKNARVISEETSLKIEVIDPLSENWLVAVTDIINILKKSFQNTE